MSRVIRKKCPNCERVNEIDLDDLMGQGKTTLDGSITQHSPIQLDENPVLVQCDPCRYPIPLTAEDAV